jgi:hypothetical protein
VGKDHTPGQASETSQAKRMAGHLLWNAGRVVSGYLEENVDRLVKGRDVLELGRRWAAEFGLRGQRCSDGQSRPILRGGYWGIRC